MLDIGAPLHGFQKIIKWARSAHTDNYQFTPANETYQGHVAHLREALQAQHFQPYEITVELPAADGSLDEIGVVVFDFVVGPAACMEMDGGLCRAPSCFLRVFAWQTGAGQRSAKPWKK